MPKQRIDKLYFGYVSFDFNTKELVMKNLFDSYRVQRSIAVWAGLDEIEKSRHDPLWFCFGDTHSRCEYEFLITMWPKEEPTLKVDIFKMYVEPNREHLLNLVSQISKAEAKRWLKEDKR